MSTGQQVVGYAQRALSLRVILGSLFVSFLGGMLVGLVWERAEMPVVWGLAAVCYLGAVADPSQMLRCDACRKRVKVGASTCHHCGYSRA